MIPAGCRSPGRCFGNHSHQPDGISVGEHEKDGSGSVLPGPARPQKQLRANSESIRGLQEDAAEPGDENVFCLVPPLESSIIIYCSHIPIAAPSRICRDIIKATRLLFESLANLGSVPPLRYFHPSVVFSNVAMLRSYGEIMRRLFFTFFFL